MMHKHTVSSQFCIKKIFTHVVGQKPKLNRILLYTGMYSIMVGISFWIKSVD